LPQIYESKRFRKAGSFAKSCLTKRQFLLDQVTKPSTLKLGDKNSFKYRVGVDVFNLNIKSESRLSVCSFPGWLISACLSLPYGDNKSCAQASRKFKA
jgi:hypothetical protein